MKQLLIEVDDDLAARLERVAPSRSRQRSKFVRDAIREALWRIEESATAAAYRAQPDTAEAAYIDERAWEAKPPSGKSRGRRRRSP